jgi:hypothetical protein
VKPVPFVPTVAEISAERAGEIPALEAAVTLWTAGGYDAEGWFREVNASWGNAGYVMRRGEEVQGFVLYGPPDRLAYAGNFPFGPPGDDAALLAAVDGDGRTRRHLLSRVMKDLKGRDIGGIEAIAADFATGGHVPTRFLLESGWRPLRHGWYGGRPYTLARTDLGSTVEVGGLARDLIGRVRFPRLSPAPGATSGSFVRARAAALLETAAKT